MKVSAKQYMRLLGTYFRPQMPRVGLLGVLLLVNIGLQLLNPQISRGFIDMATSGQPVDTLVWLGVLFVVVALVSQVLTVAATYVGENVGWTATNQLRIDLARHCINLDMSFHKSHTPGEMIERIDGDVSAMSNFFSTFVRQILGNVLLMAGVLVLLFLEDWRIGGVFTVFVLLTIFATSRIGRTALPAMKGERAAAAELFGFIEERLSGLTDIRANGGGAHAMRGLYKAMRFLYSKAKLSWRAEGRLWSTAITLFTLSDMAVIVIGAYLFASGAITLGTTVLIFQYILTLHRPLEEITDQLNDLQKASAGLVRVQELLGTEPLVTDGPGAEMAHGPLSVAFEGVSFGYGDEEMVVSNLSLGLEPGTVLGLLGRTGSGKTTLARLLLRLYDPAEGTVKLGGVDIRRLRLGQLRQAIGVVTQDVQLFNATLRENLTMFDANIQDTKILAVIHELGLAEWFNKLSDGLDTVIGSGGGGLSAGEAQLLALTRVFLRNPGLVILDEAPSRLDPATERLIERAVDRLLRDRTGIVIAHRLATVQRAGEIVVLEDGRILECGPRLQLANDPDSRFSRLLRTGLEEVLA